MDIEVFVLCDAATDVLGKLNILGTFDTFNVKELPTTYPHCAVALRIRFQKSEVGEHKVKIEFVDEDGKSMGPKLEGAIKVEMSEDSMSGVVNLALGVNGLKIEKTGQYAINLAIDGRQVSSLPLIVKEIS